MTTKLGRSSNAREPNRISSQSRVSTYWLNDSRVRPCASFPNPPSRPETLTPISRTLFGYSLNSLDSSRIELAMSSLLDVENRFVLAHVYVANPVNLILSVTVR